MRSAPAAARPAAAPECRGSCPRPSPRSSPRPRWCCRPTRRGKTEASATRSASMPCTCSSLIDHRLRIRAHATRAAGVVHGRRGAPDVVDQRCIVLGGRPGLHLQCPIAGEGGGAASPGGRSSGHAAACPHRPGDSAAADPPAAPPRIRAGEAHPAAALRIQAHDADGEAMAERKREGVAVAPRCLEYHLNVRPRQARAGCV